MPRKMTTVERIPNDVARRAAFRKRVNKLTKLSTLCNTKVCVLVYAEGEARPEVIPSVAEAVPLLRRFQATPEIEQYKKRVTQEDFLRQRMGKLTLQIQKNAPENSERDTAILLHQAMAGRLEGGLEGLTPEKYASVRWMVQMRLKSIEECIAKLQGQMAGLHLQPLPAPAPPPPSDQQEASQKEIGSVNEVRSDGGDLGTLVFSGISGGHGAGVGASTGGGFSWQWCADLGGPSSSIPPMLRRQTPYSLAS